MLSTSYLRSFTFATPTILDCFPPFVYSQFLSSSHNATFYGLAADRQEYSFAKDYYYYYKLKEGDNNYFRVAHILRTK